MNLRSLRTVSVLYLALPNALFFACWTKPLIAAAGLLSILLAVTIDILFCDTGRPVGLSVRECAGLAVMAAILTALSGTSGICFQNIDYWGHNVKFYELSQNSWPFRLPENGAAVSYYYGYYVVPALIFKAAGKVFDSAIFIWTAAGLWLGLSWLLVVLNRRWWLIPVVLCTGDLPRVAKNILGSIHIKMYEFGNFGIEHWSIFENIFWVPNQVIPCIIIVGLFGFCFKKNQSCFNLALPVAFCFWWAIFPALTLSLLLAILCLKELTGIKRIYIPKHHYISIFCSAIIAIHFLIFYQSHEFVPASGFIWNFRKIDTNIVTEYFINIAMNVIIFLFIFHCIKKPKHYQHIFFMLMFLMLILSLLRIGKVNDFLFRGMIPYLLLTGILLVEPLSKTYPTIFFKNYGLRAVAVYTILLASMGLGFSRVWRALHFNVFTEANGQFEPVPYDQYPNVYEVLRARWSQEEANQYLGKPDSFYEKIIAPPEKDEN